MGLATSGAVCLGGGALDLRLRPPDQRRQDGAQPGPDPFGTAPVQGHRHRPLGGGELSGKRRPFVPGIQFMFFATKEGGYFKDLKLTDQNYEFIVDLPKISGPADLTWAIGHTSDFPC
ncbi:MAG: hypothetical protein WKF84_30855 [Pyrinomonadaceae bacterium]